MLVAHARQQADFQARLQQLGVLQTGQFVDTTEVFAHVAGDRDVVEVVQVVIGYSPTQLADRLIPQVVQRRVELPHCPCHHHLADVERLAALLLGQASYRALEGREQHLTLVQFHHHTGGRQANALQFRQDGALEALQVGRDIGSGNGCGGPGHDFGHVDEG